MKKSYFGSYIIVILIILVCLFYYNNWFKKSEGLNYNWKLQPQIDYPGNDISNYNIKGSDCMTKCFDTKGCVGIVTEKRWASDVGTCWLKSSLNPKVKVSATNPKRFTWVKP
jgi:hypothetical protein